MKKVAKKSGGISGSFKKKVSPNPRLMKKVSSRSNAVSYFASNIVHELAQATLGLKSDNYSGGNRIYFFDDAKSLSLFKTNVTSLKFEGVTVKIVSKGTVATVVIETN